MAKKSRRGSSMGSGTRTSRKNRKLGRPWLNMPKGVSLYKEEPGETISIDVLPYIVKNVKRHPEHESMSEDVWYRFPYKIHKNVGPDRKSVLCPGTIGKPCPLCDQMQEIYDDPDADNKAASKFRPSKRSLFNIKLIKGDKKNKGKYFIWDMSDYCFFDQVDTELEHGEEEWNDFACLEGGFTLKVRLLEDSFDGNKFANADRIDFISRDDYDEDTLDEMACLDEVIIPNIKTAKEIQAIIDGDEEEEPEEEEAIPEKEKKVKKAKKEKKEKKEKKAKKPKKPIWEDMLELDEDELLELAEKHKIEVDEDDYDNEDELRNLLAEEFDIEIPEEEPKSKKKKKDKEEKEEKEEKPKKEKKSKKDKIECPFAYKFGIDFEEKDDCDEDDCECYDACFKAYDKLQEE